MCEIKQVSHKILCATGIFCKKYDEQCFHFFQTILLVPQKWCFCDDFSSGTKDFVWNLLYCINILKNMQRSDPRIPSSGRAVFPPDPWIILIFSNLSRNQIPWAGARFPCEGAWFPWRKKQRLFSSVSKSYNDLILRMYWQLIDMTYSHLPCGK